VQWTPCFTSLLISPKNYKWPKNFSESEGWILFNQNLKTTLIKVIDHCCPTHPPLCISNEHNSSSLPSKQTVVVDQLSGSSSTKKEKKKITLVESEVRRSPRLKEANKGFKPSTCSSKKCLACTANPPTLSLPLI
jgi:hypothetical protein